MIERLFDPNESLELDFRRGAVFPENVGAAYSFMRSEIDAEYLIMRTNLGNHFNGNKDWWFSEAALRNDYLCPVYHYCVIIALVSKLLELEFSIRSVAVDSKPLYQVLNQIVGRNTLLKIEANPIRWSEIVLEKLRIPTRFLKTLANLILQHLVISKKRDHILNMEAPLTLVDTFIVPSFESKDRYYPGLWEGLEQQDQDRIFFVPEFVGFSLKELYSIARVVRRNSKRHLIKNDFITFKDILFAANYWFRRNDINLPKITWRNTDITSIFRDELINTDHYYNGAIGWLNYLFVKRLYEFGARVENSIDWFENQPIDAGWNKGMHDFYPNCRIIGYQGFYSSNQSFTPIQSEIDEKITPDILYVMGKLIQKEKLMANTSLKVKIAPAYRFSWLWGLKSKPEIVEKSVLIVLPIDSLSAIVLLNCIFSIPMPPSINSILVKPHPLLPLKDIIDKLDVQFANYEELTGDIKSAFDRSVLVIGGGQSSACLEAIAYGLPILTYSLPGFDHQIPLPNYLEDSGDLKFTDQERLSSAIQTSIYNIDVLLEESKQKRQTVLSSIFSKNTKDKSQQFIFGV